MVFFNAVKKSLAIHRTGYEGACGAHQVRSSVKSPEEETIVTFNSSYCQNPRTVFLLLLVFGGDALDSPNDIFSLHYLLISLLISKVKSYIIKIHIKHINL